MTSGADDEAAPEDFDPGQAPNHGVLRRLKTEFEPWHHPRKQYVRIHQWCRSVRKLISELGLGPENPFRYLTLPGNELLDVRALHGVCETAGVKLRYLGFNSVERGGDDQAELNLSQSEVLALASIDPFSSVIEYRLEEAANQRSPAFVRTSRSAPFHAINVDLCDSIANRDIDNPRGSALGALAKLLELQLQTTRPWLLFITTLARPGLVSPRTRAGFMSAIAHNTAASVGFKHELARLLSGTAEELDSTLAQAWSGQSPDFLHLFCTGLGKWLLALLGQTAPPRKLALLSSFYYQVGPTGPDMLSLAFRCSTSQQRVTDSHGILSEAEPQILLSEAEAALQIAKELQKSSDLDQLLADNSQLTDKLIRQAGRLLATARYREDAYPQWARTEVARRGRPT